MLILHNFSTTDILLFIYLFIFAVLSLELRTFTLSHPISKTTRGKKAGDLAQVV
jgi:hypothetical protein